MRSPNNTQYPVVNFRLFSQQDACHIAKWIVDPKYEGFFRMLSVFPSVEECATYPTWTQNLVMMVCNDEMEVIGMVNAYHANQRNKTICAGILLDTMSQGVGASHAAFAQWVRFLFGRLNFRKVIAEIVDPVLVEPLKRSGFTLEGIHRQECLIDGKYVDEYRLATTPEEFRG